ncbi:MAG TPA: adenosylcobinamide-GDP ribazoletransferase, partial [Rhodocyclaceae bacterium]|nr:adenosylcobinamide-GDP ribazoletransferase [Rhodocyclaceae bacterium]
LPVPAWVGHSAEHLNRSARYFPAVGLLVGGIGALVYLAAALAYPLVQAAVNFLNEMASFESAGVSDRVSGDEPDSRSTQDAPASALTGGDVPAAGPGHHKC